MKSDAKKKKLCHTLAEPQKPEGFPSIGIDAGVRIQILSGRTCKNIYVEFI